MARSLPSSEGLNPAKGRLEGLAGVLGGRIKFKLHGLNG